MIFLGEFKWFLFVFRNFLKQEWIKYEYEYFLIIGMRFILIIYMSLGVYMVMKKLSSFSFIFLVLKFPLYNPTKEDADFQKFKLKVPFFPKFPDFHNLWFTKFSIIYWILILRGKTNRQKKIGGKSKSLF